MAGTPQTPVSSPLDLRAMARAVMRGDILLAVCVLGILTILLLPLPAWLMDVLLALSITSSVLILMTALLIQKPLEFTAFPAILLISTLFRLALNVASTRLILSEGHNGDESAGQVIAAFGEFVMGGNFVIGVVVFLVLVLINFVVITRGSTRIAEVAARFTLDSMPGKQMAIDADLSSGLISEDEARRRRKALEEESNFFGSMDGASKFVRGDAIAGLIIVLVNVIGGIIIGTLQQGMPLGEAADVYTRLTVGDGLVAQIPALIVSVAAGLLVSKAGVEGSADKAFVKQLSGYPQGLGMVAAVAFVLGILPGMPLIPFWAIGIGAGLLAWQVSRTQKAAAAELAKPEPAPVAADMPPEQALQMDDLRIELGFGLLGLINDVQGRRLTDQIKALRRQMAADLGFIAPSVRILDNMQIPPDQYVIRVKEVEVGTGLLRIGQHLAMDPTGAGVTLPGETVREPAFGLQATWIDDALVEDAGLRGYTVVDPATVLTTHLTEILKESMPDLLTFAEVRKLVRELPKETQSLLDDVVPAHITWSGVQRVLQNLLRERVSIRDLATILEAISESAPSTHDLVQITEHVRARLARQLCSANRAPDGSLALLTLSPDWEQTFLEALVGEGGQRQLALAPSRLHQFVADVRAAFDRVAELGETPVLLTGPVVRPYVRSLIERFRPSTVVMSQNEIHPKVRLRALGQV
jgi:flagellar biosynthesis protein FlhA